MRWFLLLIVSASAVWAQPLVNMQTVVVSDVNNAPDSQGLGAVSYPYRIGKFEVTIDQYTVFLNSVATNASTAHLAALWRTNMTMAMSPNIAGISRAGSGTPADPYIYEAVGGGNRPIAFVSWFGAARFCNWLHNGATNGANTETGVYALNDATSGSAPSKNTDALYWIPTQDEWMKAGFYKSGTTNAGYWMFPTQSDSAPGNLVGATPNQANYPTASGYSAPQGTWTPTANMLTDVGAFAASASAYGTFDQGGGLREILDWGGTSLPARGGSWDSSLRDILSLQRTNQASWISPSTVSTFVGFRVAAKAAQPVITLLGANPMEVYRGTPFADPGATMIDASNISSSIVGTGIVNTSVLGSYSLVYTGSDSSGLPAQPVTRTINVVLDPTADDDQDGLTNQLEQNLGSNPDLVDSNADGIDDGRAYNNGYNPMLNLSPIINSLKQTPVDGLYNQSQYDANRTAGQQDVIANPTAYSLYTPTSIMDLRMGGLMIQKQGTDATIVFQPQTTTDLVTLPFTNNGPPITNAIPMPGDKGFLRVGAIYVPAGDLTDVLNNVDVGDTFTY